MRPLDKTRPSFASCARCDTYLVKHSLDTVPGPDGTTTLVQVYECPSCSKFAPQEIASGTADEAA
jgi:uncharacterized protein with PIN domain